MKCALTKILPFILTLFVGLAMGNFRWWSGSHQVGAGQQETLDDMPYRRTWLVIHDRPQPSFPEEAGETGRKPCAVSLRVRFDVSGKVSTATSEDSDAPEDCVAAALSAAGRIVFSPASENGNPVAVVATISYGFSEMRVRVLDEDHHAPYCLTRRIPVSSPVEIVSVEGAKEREGWRVVYE